LYEKCTCFRKSHRFCGKKNYSRKGLYNEKGFRIPDTVVFFSFRRTVYFRNLRKYAPLSPNIQIKIYIFPSVSKFLSVFPQPYSHFADDQRRHISPQPFETEFINVLKEPKNRFQGIDSASLCSLWWASIRQMGCRSVPPGWESIPGLLKRFTNSGSVYENATFFLTQRTNMLSFNIFNIILYISKCTL
jgi:hypothetical protein